MNELEIKKNSGAIEAILFIYGEPLATDKIADILSIEKDKIQVILDTLGETLKADGMGLTLLFQGAKVQLVTKPDFAQVVEKLVKEEHEENLTPAALETLSLIGYLGPIPRSQIDYYRGVNSSYTVRNLMIRGLVDKVPHPDNQHVSLYQVSFDLLKHLGISKIEELPDYQKFQTILADKKDMQEGEIFQEPGVI